MTTARGAGTIDAVLPLLARDCERAAILFDSLRLFRDLGTVWTVVPDEQVAYVRERLRHPRVRLLAESEAVPTWRFYQNVCANSFGRWSIRGWYAQQLIKLALADRVETPFYITLDSDVICVNPVTHDDLVRDGRAMNQRSTREEHPKWYRSAARVLGVRRAAFEYGVTPAIFSRDAMLALHRHLADRVSRPIRVAGRGLPARIRPLVSGWQAYLLRNLPWTEYSLYGTFLEARGVYERYHWDAGPHAMHGQDVWYRDGFDTWDPGRLRHQPNTYFCVVQSTTGIDPAAVRARLQRSAA